MSRSNFLVRYYAITHAECNSRVKQMHLYNIGASILNKDVAELNHMYTDVIHINSTH